MRLIAQGEGPAYLALHTTDIAAVTKRFDAARQVYVWDGSFVKLLAPALRFFFFYEGDNRSPTDRPEYFAHRNTTSDLIGVWLATNDMSALSELFKSLGATVSRKHVFVPAETVATVAQLGAEEITLLAGSRQVHPGRPIIGATLRTGDLQQVRRLLMSGGFPKPTFVQSPEFRSLIVPPTATHGIWLEFRSSDDCGGTRDVAN